MTEASIQGWNLDNSYARLPKIFYASVDPTPVESPSLVILNDKLAKEMGLDPQDLEIKDGVAIFAGNKLPEGAYPLAQAYAGHQFGYFTMLGDGRALLLGEQITPRGNRLDIQLKGSGETPYSRGGDGRAALGPMLREYIISEAMSALGIPTTRSLAVVTTGEPVFRESQLPGAILTRVAASHLRVGTFQYAAKWGTVDDLRALADYAIQRHFKDSYNEQNPYLELLRQVIKHQAGLIAQWQLVGFIHGVMNTDNMTISGETIDYGPCAFMDTYDPATVFSSIDTRGRYAYGNQPRIGAWNLTRFAETLLPLLDDDQEQAVTLAKEAVSDFHSLFDCNWLKGMRRKLGLFNQEQGDRTLIEELLSLMQQHGADYTNTFRALTIGSQDGAIFASPEYASWHQQWQTRLSRQPESSEEVQQLMQDNNPAVIPRNHRVEEALSSAVDDVDYTVMKKLLDVLAKPFAYSIEQTEYSSPPDPSSHPYRTYCGT